MADQQEIPYWEKQIGWIYSKVTALKDEVWNAAQGVSNSVYNQLFDVNNGVVTRINNGIVTMGNWLEGKIADVKGVAQDALDYAKDTYNHVRNYVDTMLQDIAEVADDIRDDIVDAVSTIISDISARIDETKQAISDLWDNVKKRIQGVIEEVQEQAKEIMEKVKEGISSVIGTVTYYSNQIIAKIQTSITNVINHVTRKAEEIITKAVEVGEAVKSYTKGLIDNLKDTFKEGLDNMMLMFTSIFTSFQEWVESLLKIDESMLVDWIIKGFKIYKQIQEYIMNEVKKKE